MLGFFFKKAFFDGWDHLFSLLLLNLGFCLLVILGLSVPPLLKAAGLVAAFYALLILLASVWLSVSAFALNRVADYGQFGFRDMPALMKAALLPGLEYGALLILIFVALRVGLPFYLSSGNFVSALAAGILLWVSVFLLLSLQWFLPLAARQGNGFRKNLKRSFLLFGDNPLFSIFLGLYNLVTALISIFLAFLMPGFAGVALASDDALRLRLFKYDWLEKHPGLDARSRRNIPWDELLAEDRELVGKRTLKGMIFPWKE
jgi:hypothetical protein